VTDAPALDARARWTYLGLAALAIVLWLAILPQRPLFNPDEGRYAEIPREMLATGDWVVPHLNGLVYVEKPPLQYWATAAALALFGLSEFGARIYTALCAFATLGVVWLAAQRLWGAAAAWRAAAVLASMLLFVILGQLLTLDMSLTFYLTLSLVAFLLAQHAAAAADAAAPGAGPKLDPNNRNNANNPNPNPNLDRNPSLNSNFDVGVADGRRRAQRRWMLIAWAAAALGVLTKGVVAAVIPGAALVLYSLYTRDFAPWRRLQAALGLPLFLALTVPWHWLAALRVPDFLRFFFVHEHLQRFMTPSADRQEAWWFFAAVFFIGGMPWSLSALRVLVTGWRRRAPHGGFEPAVFLWVWVVFVCVFFSLSDSKLIPYILPAMPAVALLVAASSEPDLRRDLAWTALGTVLTAALLAAAAHYGPQWLRDTHRSADFALLARPLEEIAALLAVSGLYVLLRSRRAPTSAVVFLGVGWCLAGLLLMRAAGLVAPLYSGVGLARALGPPAADAPLYTVETYDQTLPFYWQRTFTLVAYRGELDFGLRAQPQDEIPSVAAFVQEWGRLTTGYAVLENGMFDTLVAQGVPMRELARNAHRVVVARR
jgi:4-amino-4-deoxy-L-arabinose transferase-like glycosyltransferase